MSKTTTPVGNDFWISQGSVVTF